MWSEILTEEPPDYTHANAYGRQALCMFGVWKEVYVEQWSDLSYENSYAAGASACLILVLLCSYTALRCLLIYGTCIICSRQEKKASYQCASAATRQT